MAAVSWPVPQSTASSLTDATLRSETRNSPPPPTAARLPPDGHEFPPDFPVTEQSAFHQTEGSEVPQCATGVTRRPRSWLSPERRRTTRDHRARSVLLDERADARYSGSACRRSESMTESERRNEKSRPRHPSESDISRFCTKWSGNRASVRDRIALFSCSSRDKLSDMKTNPSGRVGNELECLSGRHCQAQSKNTPKLDPKVPDYDNRHSNEMQLVTKTQQNAERSDDCCTVNLGKPENVQLITYPEKAKALSSQCSIPISDSHSPTGLSESSEEPDSFSSCLSERSQSLFDLGGVEKRHSYAGFHTLRMNKTATDLPRKISLQAGDGNRKKGFSRLRGLIIPRKTDGITKKGPPDMPAIKSKNLATLNTSVSILAPEPSPRSSIVSGERLSRSTSHHLTMPPWKAESSNIPKYSPAFKRKNVSVYSSPRSSAFHPLSSSSQLGGSSIELSHSLPTVQAPTDSNHHRTHERSPLGQKAMDLVREPLQRSSSLNSRPSGSGGETRRRISDDMPGSQGLTIAEDEPDVGSSTLTLVAEPVDGGSSTSERLRSRANSVEFDYRASTSTLHYSPVEELNIEDGFTKVNTRDSIEEELSVPCNEEKQGTKLVRPTSVSRSFSSATSCSDRTDRLGVSPPKLKGDNAWRKFGSIKDNLVADTMEARDLSKLRQSTTKPSVKSLKEKYQTLSNENDSLLSPCSTTQAIRPTSVTRSTSAQAEMPTITSSSLSDDTPHPEVSTSSSAKECTGMSVRDVVDRNWPSIESERADIDRKLSTPAFGDGVIRRRDRKDRLPSRPQSWIENERELKVIEMTSLMSSMSTASCASSQENIMDALDVGKSPSSSTSSLLEMLTANLKNAGSQHVLSVSDLRRAFEKCEHRTSNGEEAHVSHHTGSHVSLHSTKDHYGSITSLASSTSLISPHELQQLIEEANQSLEEAGTPSHEIIVAVIHREMKGGSVGITLAGGVDYDNKEISVNKVITGSVADRDGRIKKGDRVISINGRSMKGYTHREALNVLKAPRSEVVLVLSRSRSVTPSSTLDDLSIHKSSIINTFSSRPPKILESPMDSKSLLSALEFEDVPRASAAEVTLLKEGAGVGFSLEGGKDSPLGDRPLVAKKIFAGGAADKSGKLDVGDQILAINGHDVTHMPRLEAWNFLKKQAEGPLRLTIRKRAGATLSNGAPPALESGANTLPPGERRMVEPPGRQQVGNDACSQPVITAVTIKTPAPSAETAALSSP